MTNIILCSHQKEDKLKERFAEDIHFPRNTIVADKLILIEQMYKFRWVG